MIKHAMHYVLLAERVEQELAEHPYAEGVLAHLKDVRADFLEAERAMAHAYTDWRNIMHDAKNLGSERAAKYLERSEWDLT